MFRLRLPLLVKVVVTLAATGLLPLAISFYQLRLNKDALLRQIESTHMVAARATAAQIEAVLEPLASLAQTVAETATLSPAALEQLLAGTLQTWPDVGGAWVFNDRGEEVIRAQRRDLPDEVDPGYDAYDAAAPRYAFLEGRARRWLRVVEPIPGDRGQVVLMAEARDLEAAVASAEIGEEARLVLARLDGSVAMGPDPDLSAFPRDAVAAALSDKVRSGSNKYEGPETKEDVVVAYAQVAGTPWVVLSRQPARQAEIAQRQIRRVSWFAALVALALTAALSSVAHATVIRPLRRLIRAQRELTGVDAAPGGSEIEQLEASFALLEQRVRDREDLGKVFLGRYQVVDMIGSGAMGTVFKGWDPKLDRPLALKTIRLETEEGKRERLTSTLLKEAKTSAGFSHPNIVTVYDAAGEGAAAFIAMEFVDGITLEDLINYRGRLDWREVVPLGAAVASGLAAAHARHLVHQDVKPANILLGRDHSIKVTDFGISQLVSSAHPTEGVVCGTPGFIAPECLEGGVYSPKSDLFALGVLLYECLSGQHPFASRNLRVTIINTLNKEPDALGDLRPDLPAELERLIFQLMDKNPSRRPQDAEAVTRVLEALAAEHGLAGTLVLPADDEPVARPVHAPLQRTQVLSLQETRAISTRRSRQPSSAP